MKDIIDAQPAIWSNQQLTAISWLVVKRKLTGMNRCGNGVIRPKLATLEPVNICNEHVDSAAFYNLT